LVKGKDRRENVLRSLRLIKEDIKVGKKVLVKPNFVSTLRQLSATHVDAVWGVLNFLSGLGVRKFLIAEGPAYSKAEEGFRNFGYWELKDEYDAEFLDLNEDEYDIVEVYDRGLNPMEVRVSKTVLESDFRVSVAPMKTHYTVIATLSLKNMLVGALIDHDKSKIHQGYKAINLSLYRLAGIIPPHLSVIDGFLAMEGDGPLSGSAVELGIAISSTDFLAADTVGTMVMGFDPSDIGYLSYCKEGKLGTGELSKIEILGEDIEACRKDFRPHRTYEEQLKWR
jgi:uncharacterized protein (DUF362 family)